MHVHVHIHVLYMYYGLVNLGLLVCVTQIKMTMMVAAHWLRSQDYLYSPTTLAMSKVKPILFTCGYKCMLCNLYHRHVYMN